MNSVLHICSKHQNLDSSKKNCKEICSICIYKAGAKNSIKSKGVVIVKGFVSLTLALIMCLSLTISAMAAGRNTNFVLGEAKYSETDNFANAQIVANQWAKADIERALRLNLLDKSESKDFTSNIARTRLFNLLMNLSVQCGLSECSDLEGMLSTPKATVTRGEMALFLYKTILLIDPSLSFSANVSKFSDIPSTSTDMGKAVEALAEANIAKGTSTEIFSPQQPLSEEQAVVLVYRAYKFLCAKKVFSLAEQYAREQINFVEQMQKSYGPPFSTFSDSRVNNVEMAEVFSYGKRLYLLFNVDYSVKADNPENVKIFDYKMENGWLSDPMPSTLVVSLKAPWDFSYEGGYKTEFTSDGNNEIYYSDFKSWIDELNQ
jgi:hypothetical protein